MKFNLDINNLLEQIANYLGTTVDNIRPALTTYLGWATKDVLVKGIIWCLFGIILLVISYKLLKSLNKWKNSQKYDGSYCSSDPTIYGLCITGIVTLFFMASLIELLNIPKIINPQYHAVQNIISSINDKR